MEDESPSGRIRIVQILEPRYSLRVERFSNTTRQWTVVGRPKNFAEAKKRFDELITHLVIIEENLEDGSIRIRRTGTTRFFVEVQFPPGTDWRLFSEHGTLTAAEQLLAQFITPRKSDAHAPSDPSAPSDSSDRRPS